MRYRVPGKALNGVSGIPERLKKFGPWEITEDPNGMLITAKDWPAASYSESRKTPEGWDYFPSAPVTLGQLYRDKTVQEACNLVELESGDAAWIRPAYLEPLKIFTNGTMGDPLTNYGLRARRVMDLLTARDPLGVLHPESINLWVDSIGITYRAPPEVMDDLSAFSVSDIDNIVAAILAGPKPQPGAGSSPSPSPG